MNTALKAAFFERDTTQVAVAKKIGIREARMSRIVRGHDDPTDDEKKAIAKVLRRRIDQIFPSETVATS